MNPPQRLDLNIIEAVWDQKAADIQRRALGCPYKKPGELFLKTTYVNHKKTCLRCVDE